MNKKVEKYKMKTKLKPELKKKLKNKVVLITGGAGSIGSAITKKLLKYPIKAVRVLDTNEYALFQLKHSVNDFRLRPLLGNILDLERIEMATNNVDFIIHAAAVKNIEITEFNPIETIDVNTSGTVNMIKMAIKNKPKIFLNISTDKAAEPNTLYGTTKQLGERITSWAGVHILTTKFASARFGNVIETKGNVFEIWEKEASENLPLSITDPSMERYFFHIEEAVDFILDCLILANKGEIFVPKIKKYNIKKLALKISKKHKIIGLRQGEKIEEILITSQEKMVADENKKMWIIKNYTDV